MKYPKDVTWYKQKLEKTIQVSCCLGELGLPHIVTIDSVTMIGADSKPHPYAFCPEHNAYFGISADTNMDKMIVRLDDEEIMVKKQDENGNNPT